MRTARIDPAVVAHDDGLGKRRAAIERSRDHRLSDVAEHFAPGDVHGAVPRDGDRCPTADAGLIVDLGILLKGGPLVLGTGDISPGGLLAAATVDPGDVDRAVPTDANRIETMIHQFSIVIDQGRGKERLASINGTAE